MSERPTLRTRAKPRLSGTRHVIRFFGAVAAARRAPFLRDLLDVVVDAAQQATRLKVDGRSTAPGVAPAWLDAATAFEVVDLGDAEVVLQAPALADAAPQRFRQRDLFGPDVPQRSCLDHFEDSLEDALAEREDSDLYDRSLMGTLEGLGRLFRHGVERIEIVNGRTLQVEAAGIDAICALRRRTPEDRRVIVGGKLDAIRYSDRAFTLVLTSGETVRGVAVESVEPATLGALFGKAALVSGIAKFRPSGKLLRIEAERVDAAPDDLGIWSTLPRPLDLALDLRDARTAPGTTSPLAALFGSVPMEEGESEEEFRAAVEEMS